MELSPDLGLVGDIDALQVVVKADLAKEEVAGWVLGLLLELGLGVVDEGLELCGANLCEEQMQAHEWCHILLEGSQLGPHVLQPEGTTSCAAFALITI